MKRPILTFTIAAMMLPLLSGCANLSFSRFLGEQLGLTQNRLANPQVVDYLKELPVAQMLVKAPGRNPALFLLATLDGSREVWVDGAGFRLVRDRGQILTAQLPGIRGQFQPLHPLDASPFLGPIFDAGQQDQQWASQTVRLLVDGTRISEQRVQVQSKGDVLLDTPFGEVATQEVHEQVEDEFGRRWVNRYWLLMPSQYVLRSDFKWNYDAPSLRLDVIKAPANALVANN